MQYRLHWEKFMGIRETLAKSIFDQTDETTTVPLSIRFPNHLNMLITSRTESSRT